MNLWNGSIGTQLGRWLHFAYASSLFSLDHNCKFINTFKIGHSISEGSCHVCVSISIEFMHNSCSTEYFDICSWSFLFVDKNLKSSCSLVDFNFDMRVGPVENRYFLHGQTLSGLCDFKSGISNVGIVRSFDNDFFSLSTSRNNFRLRWFKISVPAFVLIEGKFREHHIEVDFIELYFDTCSCGLNYFELLILLDNFCLELFCFFVLCWVDKFFIFCF